MSRCFPFPPPGYEKKARLGDTDLITKEKHKEKKHKKDKKDKEKREGKERKKDKDRSDRKHKEKKERKEKNEDQKDRDRDKEKKNNLVEKNTVGPQNGEKLDSKYPQSGDTTESKFLLELGKRIKDEGGAKENQTFQSITVKYQKSGGLPGGVVEINTGNSTEGKEKYKNRKDGGRNVNDQRNQVEARVVENGFLQGSNGTDQKRVGNSIEGKEKYKNKREGDRNVKGQRDQVEARGVQNGFVQGFNGMDQKRIGLAGPVDKDVKKQEEQKKHKHKDGDSRGDRQKGRGNGETSKPNDKDRTKEKEKEGKAKEKEPRKEQLLLRESSKDGIDGRNMQLPHLLKEGNKSSTYNINLGKRKELEMNGFAHDDGIRSNKLPKLISSPHQLVENGTKLEPGQSALQLACERPVAASNHKVEGKVSSFHQILQNGRKLEPNPAVNSGKTHKDSRINGSIATQQLNTSSSKPLSTPSRAKERVDASAKLPHPDSKYLSQIYFVPNVNEWSDFDDQEWLLGNDKLQTKKPEAGPLEVVDGTPQVWAQALRIESMDVTVLPYVIPF